MLDDLFWIAEDFGEDIAAYLSKTGILLNIKFTQYGVTVWSDTQCDPTHINDCFAPFHNGCNKSTFTSFEEVVDYFNTFYGENDTSHAFDGEIGCSDFDSKLDNEVLSEFIENPNFHFFYHDVFGVHKFTYKGFTYVYDHIDPWNGHKHLLRYINKCLFTKKHSNIHGNEQKQAAELRSSQQCLSFS